MMAWQDDPREDARPFQMGMAARNGVTAALLARERRALAVLEGLDGVQKMSKSLC